ncbi:hypothetical protein [Afipia sp. Root123D2]|uniref:hypothetical protein n=1 Tax=Afipia sp. Root123D2 TaxID=1736436 RepID=UPI0012E98E76|nr:hypothetical protein [Afipia sp. Root123D2]
MLERSSSGAWLVASGAQSQPKSRAIKFCIVPAYTYLLCKPAPRRSFHDLKKYSPGSKSLAAFSGPVILPRRVRALMGGNDAAPCRHRGRRAGADLEQAIALGLDRIAHVGIGICDGAGSVL